MHSRHLFLILALPVLVTGGARAVRVERVIPNDNRTASGVMRGDSLELRLDARMAMWHPHADDGPGALIPAFAAGDAAPSVPGPLVRVPAGTTVRVTLRNSLPDTLLVQGLQDRTATPVQDVPIVLAPGEVRQVSMRLDAPGTYFYWGTTTRRALNFRTLEDGQLTGAIVVDEADGQVSDRVLVIGMWTDTVHRAGTHRRRVLAVVNGRSWPHTERFHFTVGDTVRWRVINASADLHPMHLHGFYFRVDARGNGRQDTSYAPSARQMVVTESMGTGATVRMTWVPERAGNWLFHCHVPEHFGTRGPMGMERALGAHHDHAKEGMSGLVTGIHVRAAPGMADAAPARVERRMRLLVREGTGGTRDEPAYHYSLHERGTEPPLPAARGIGPTLDLIRGEPVRITIVNRLREPTAVHWHGIELESYFDGVPGFSGNGSRVTPLIVAGDSFTVRFTPPRAGTFIYHTHADEVRQQYAGLSGVLVVNEERVRDPARDIPILISEFRSADGTVSTLVNGSATPAPLVLRAGTTYRLRLVHMSVARSVVWAELWRDSSRARWRPIAKDGADLAEAARVSAVARLRFGIGETYDFEFTPDVAGPMRLEVRQGITGPVTPPLYTTLPIAVKP